ncbi:MAG TPA: GldG family protein, partial [Sphingomonadales bacterium]
MKRFGLTLNRAVLIAVAAILFVAVNVLSTTLLKSARVDLTADRLYTLSDGTRRILAGIEEPITLRLFFSDAAATPYPSIKSYGQRVRSLLQEYEALADGGIRLEIIDPEPFSTAEDDAVAAGLQGIRTNGGDTIYFGLVGTNATDLQ